MNLTTKTRRHEVIIQEIAYGSPIYELTKTFREEVLRKPLGLKLSDEDIKGEDSQIHIAALQNDIVVGTIVLKRLPEKGIKLRQMAVSPSFQKSGIGRDLVQFAENFSKAKDYNFIEMTARISAQGFYEKLGYQIDGARFTEVTLPVIKMVKSL